MRRYAPAVVCLVVLLVSYGRTQQCGGSERWAVKDGTDNTANQIDLSHVQETTIQKLINDIHQPKLPHDDTTRVIPDETKVVHFTARLVQWKHELDDDDYHLVLTDDSLRFTPHEGPPTRTSIIGEIPNPDCLPGKHGNFGNHSPFVNVAGGGTPLGIAIARKQLEDEFPDADMSGKFNDAGGVPVEITGVIFFDRPHGQVGRGPNNLEIHPILSIKFKQHPVEFIAAAHAPMAHVVAAAPAAGGGQGPGPGPQNPQNVTIQDATTGATATVTDGKAVKVDASGSIVNTITSHNSGASGNLQRDVSSPDLGFPKTLTVCWSNAIGAQTDIQMSIDGTTWFPYARFGEISSCMAIPPVRFIKIVSASSAGFYQASY